MEGQARQVAVLKAKNQIDLLDFKIDVVGDDPDDWDEIREMRSTIDAQSERLKRVESTEAKLSNEVFLLRGQLDDANALNKQNSTRIGDLE